MKIIVISFCFLILSGAVYPSQEQAKKTKDSWKFSLQIFEFVTELNQSINGFFNQEKTDRLYRELGYFSIDLSNYLSTRERLVNYIEKKQDKLDGKIAKALVNDLKVKLAALNFRFDHLKSQVLDGFKDGADIVQRSQRPLVANDSEVLTPLQDFLNGEKITEGKQVFLRNLLVESKQIRHQLDITLTTITSLRDQIKAHSASKSR